MNTMVGARYSAGIGGFFGTGRPVPVAPADARHEAIERVVGMATAASPVLFLATATFLEAVQPGYDRIRDTVSALVWGPGGWAQTAVFFLFGFVLIALALELRRALRSTRLLSIGLVLLAVMGLAFVVMGIFPTGLPGDEPTTPAAIHEYAACAVSALFPVLCFTLAVALRHDLRWRKLGLYTAAVGVLAVTLTAAGAVALFTDAGWLGAVERFMLGNGLVWVEVAAVYCLMMHRHGAFQVSLGVETARRPTRNEAHLSAKTTSRLPWHQRLVQVAPLQHRGSITLGTQFLPDAVDFPACPPPPFPAPLFLALFKIVSCRTHKEGAAACPA